MRKAALLSVWCGIASLVGCAETDRDWHGDVGSTAGEDGTTAPHLLDCNGLCVATAPATYTGPSLFWLGEPYLVPECPAETPYQGLEGYLAGSQDPLFARECRITPSDLCEDEGLTCAPFPREDFHVCIHHDAESPCPAEYPQRSTMSEIESQMTLTLCCQESPIPG